MTIWIAILLAIYPFPGPGVKPAGGGGAYSGPGDVQTGGSAWYGLRAYSAAKAGHVAINVCNVADAACADMSTDAVTGALTITTIGGSDCGSVTCTIKKIYDQTQGNNCNAMTCDLSQATIALRPTLTLSCISGKPCMTFAPTQFLVGVNAPGATMQPFTASMVAERTGAFTSYQNVVGTSSGQLELGFDITANKILLYDGSLANATAADSAFHAVQALWNSASSVIYVDGSSNAVAQLGTPIPFADFLCMGLCANGFTGKAVEGGWWFADKSASFSALNTNQHVYWGF